MKVELDARPKRDELNRESYHIRLLPETNEEMASLKWMLDVFKDVKPKVSENAFPDRYEVAISFHPKN